MISANLFGELGLGAGFGLAQSTNTAASPSTKDGPILTGCFSTAGFGIGPGVLGFPLAVIGCACDPSTNDLNSLLDN